ncbi:hypothetical protein AZF37_02870 [endosymbiont 'TC1' of Trimyema compressum]|uniref:hypothetical protein n=1 Tax=endosymbiont 'TC1' of Trimyema compressum TaxID=243899 RepID=UPI0007F0F335|nr:hypothetical protein [endosymbiont 'TC1' of Trimyema compressum]AMP20255.1 hypothetical protein AZF37_02870 [endosymbiont 'TC1' of Trimyema compressum]
MTTLEERSLKTRELNKQKLKKVIPLVKVINGYFVGGCVRDYIINKEIEDIDLVTEHSFSADSLNKAFPNSCPKECGALFGVLKMNYENMSIDIAKTRDDHYATIGKRRDCAVNLNNISLKEDMQRRDFTMNSLLLDEDLEVVDLLKVGLNDLKEKRIRFIGEGERRIEEDPLRSIRAIRFYSQLDEFQIEEATLKAIYDKRDLVKLLSKERWGMEFEKILLSNKACEGICLIMELGLLEYNDTSFKLEGLDSLPKNSILRYAYLFYCIGLSKSGVEVGHLSKSDLYSIKWLSSNFNKSIDLNAWANDFKSRIPCEKHIKLLSILKKEPIVLGEDIYFINELAINGYDLLGVGVNEKQIGFVLRILLNCVKSGKLINKKNQLLDYVKERKIWR